MAFTGTTPSGASFSSPAEWYDQYLADLTALGGSLAQEEYTPYGGPRVAEWTPDQLQAFSRVRDAADMWRPYVDPALKSLQAGQGGLTEMSNMIRNSVQFNRGTPLSYRDGQTGAPQIADDGGMYAGGTKGWTDQFKGMNNFTPTPDPMTGGVMPNGVDQLGGNNEFWRQQQPGGINEYRGGTPGQPMPQNNMSFGTFYDVYSEPTRAMQQAARSIGARNFENTTLKQLSDAFTGTGQFGSGRHQILGADAAAQAQAQIEEAVAGIDMQATQNAMGDYYKWAQQGLQGANQMGDYAANQAKMGMDLMNFGLGTQRAAMADASAIGNIGQQQQTMNQQNLNLGYQDFLEQQNYPWQQLDKWSALTRGQQIPNYQSQVQLPATVPTTYQNPWMSGLQGAAGGWNLGSSFK